jgi:CBS-domain-containing membrane protein
VWWRNGDRLKATVAASRAGRVLGFALIGAGLAMFAYSGAADGLWLSVIGWFLMGAARTEQGQAQLRHALDGISVADVMTPDPAVAPGWFTVQAFIDNYLMNHRHSAFPIEGWGSGLAGLVTLSRLRMVPASQRSFVRVIDVAIPLDQVPTGRPDEPLVALLERMPGADRKALIVDDDGRLVGIVTTSDVTRALAHASLRAPAPASPLA